MRLQSCFHWNFSVCCLYYIETFSYYTNTIVTVFSLKFRHLFKTQPLQFDRFTCVRLRLQSCFRVFFHVFSCVLTQISLQLQCRCLWNRWRCDDSVVCFFEMVTMKTCHNMCQITIAFAFASMVLLILRHLSQCNSHDNEDVCVNVFMQSLTSTWCVQLRLRLRLRPCHPCVRRLLFREYVIEYVCGCVLCFALEVMC